MPPLTPRTTLRPASMTGSAGVVVGESLTDGERELLSNLLDRLRPHDLVGVDLLEGEAERLASGGGDLRRNHVTEAITELVEVGVDVPGPAGGQGDERELGVDATEEVLDRRAHHGVVRLGHGNSSCW